MVPIETLRDWAGLTAGDSSKDALLQAIAAGVQALISKQANLRIMTPPGTIEQIVNVPPVYTGGVSLLEATSTQRVDLSEEPRRIITGTVSVDAEGTTVTGDGTLFLSQLSADPASALEIEGEEILVDSISDNEVLELAEPHEAGASGVAARVRLVSIESRSSPSLSWAALDPRDYEIDGPAIFTTSKALPCGRRTVRVKYLYGDEIGEGRKDIELVFLRMFKLVYRNKTSSSRKVRVSGAFEVDWGELGEQQEQLRTEVSMLRRSVGLG